MLNVYKNRNRVMALDLKRDGVSKEVVERYQDLADWFEQAIKREEALLKEES